MNGRGNGIEKPVLQQARDMVMLEGHLLDRRDWDNWLDLYWEEASYWLPAWKSDDTPTSDPARELSLIYYANRSGLEDRVFRIRTDQSLASSPLLRSCHIVSITNVLELPNGDIHVDANWVVHVYRLEKAHAFFGQQTHIIRRFGTDLKFISRRTLIYNDVIPDVLDVYCI